jgi:hypothetical protein
MVLEKYWKKYTKLRILSMKKQLWQFLTRHIFTIEAGPVLPASSHDIPIYEFSLHDMRWCSFPRWKIQFIYRGWCAEGEHYASEPSGSGSGAAAAFAFSNMSCTSDSSFILSHVARFESSVSRHSSAPVRNPVINL